MTIELIFVLFCGLAFGSFVTLASWRLPREQDIVVMPSRCPQCETKLGFLDLWPVLSWVFSGGKCRHCKTRISVRYPLTEIVTALLFVGIYALYGLTLQAGLLMLLGVGLMVMIVADIEHYIIPDEVHIALLPLGLLYHYVMATPPGDVASGFVAGAAIGLTLHYGYSWLRKREMLGYGDVKFFAVAGLWLTLMPIVPFLFFSGLFGILFGLLWRVLGKGPVFPFGPALAASLFLCVVMPAAPDAFWHFPQLLAGVIGDYLYRPL